MFHASKRKCDAPSIAAAFLLWSGLFGLPDAAVQHTASQLTKDEGIFSCCSARCVSMARGLSGLGQLHQRHAVAPKISTSSALSHGMVEGADRRLGADSTVASPGKALQRNPTLPSEVNIHEWFSRSIVSN
jgi:hypothetical protein